GFGGIGDWTAAAMIPYLPVDPEPKTAEDALLTPFSAERYPLSSTVRQIEGHARDWADLVPENPQLRAAVAHLLGRKYRFTYAALPQLRAALGLDGDDVREAYHSLFGVPLDEIYAPQMTPSERLRWVWTAFGQRVDALPPFWFTFLFIF